MRDAIVHQLQGHRFGAVREQVQLHLRVLGGRAAQHGTDQARLKLAQVAHGAERRAALSVQRFRVRLAAEQALVFGESDLDFGILRQHGGAVRDAEAFRGFALGREEVADAVLGHDARGFLRQRTPQVLVPCRMFLAHFVRSSTARHAR